MVWLRVDDRELEQRRWQQLEIEHGTRVYADCVAYWLHLSCVCARRIGDPGGIVPDGHVATTDLRRVPALETGIDHCLAAMVEVGLLAKTDLRGAPFVFVDWRQPSSDQVVRDRALAAERKERWKANRASKGDDGNAVPNAVPNAVQNAPPGPSRPVPSRSEDRDQRSPKPARKPRFDREPEIARLSQRYPAALTADTRAICRDGAAKWKATLEALAEVQVDHVVAAMKATIEAAHQKGERLPGGYLVSVARSKAAPKQLGLTGRPGRGRTQDPPPASAFTDGEGLP